jgi:regulator of sigma E protease
MTLVGLVGLVGNLIEGLVGLIIMTPGAGAELSAVGDSVAGPVGILGAIFPNAMMAGPTQLFFLMAVISLTLTVMNLLPIPGLDGGRWFVTAIYRLRKKPLTKAKEQRIVGWGMVVLFGLIILITVADIWKLFG